MKSNFLWLILIAQAGLCNFAFSEEGSKPRIFYTCKVDVFKPFTSATPPEDLRPVNSFELTVVEETGSSAQYRIGSSKPEAIGEAPGKLNLLQILYHSEPNSKGNPETLTLTFGSKTEKDEKGNVYVQHLVSSSSSHKNLQAAEVITLDATSRLGDPWGQIHINCTKQP